MRALLVDDDQPTTETLALLLHREGFVVEWATDAALALTLSQQFRPTLVTTELAALAANPAAQIRELRAGSTVGVIALTSGDPVTGRARALRAGADAHVPKPINKPRFLAELHSVLERRGPRDLLDLRDPLAASPGPGPAHPHHRRRSAMHSLHL